MKNTTLSTLDFKTVANSFATNYQNQLDNLRSKVSDLISRLIEDTNSELASELYDPPVASSGSLEVVENGRVKDFLINEIKEKLTELGWTFKDTEEDQSPLKAVWSENSKPGEFYVKFSEENYKILVALRVF